MRVLNHIQAMRNHNRERMAIILKQRMLVFSVLLLAAVFMFSSCDEHDPLDLGIHPGFVLCDDHQVMSLDDYKAQLEGPHAAVAVGVIFATANEEHKTLAVMLFENEGISYSNYIPLDCGSTRDDKAFDGYLNSVNMNSTYEKKKYKVDEPDPDDPTKTVTVEYEEEHFSPLGRWVFDSHRNGQSDHIPSYAECRLLYSVVNTVNATIRELGGQEISVTNDNSCWYWTSTEDQVDPQNRAWLCSMGTGGFQQTPKTERHRARAIVALNY